MIPSPRSNPFCVICPKYPVGGNCSAGTSAQIRAICGNMFRKNLSASYIYDTLTPQQPFLRHLSEGPRRRELFRRNFCANPRHLREYGSAGTFLFHLRELFCEFCGKPSMHFHGNLVN